MIVRQFILLLFDNFEFGVLIELNDLTTIRRSTDTRLVSRYC